MASAAIVAGPKDLPADAMRAALFNILEDLSEEKQSLERTFQGTLNIIEDLDQESRNRGAGNAALFNILEDYQAENLALRRSQTATLNLLEDLDAERTRSESNIAALRQALQARQAAEDELRRVANYLRSVFQAAPDPLVAIDTEGRITDINDAASSATGLPRDRLIGSDFAELFNDPGAAHACWHEALRIGVVREHPLELRHLSGAVMDVLLNACIYCHQDGTVAGVVAMARDVTIRRRAEIARNRALRALRMLNVCNNLIIHATDEHQLLADICQAIVEIGAFRLAWIGYAQDDAAKSVIPIASAGDDAGFTAQAAVCWADNERGGGPTGIAIRTGEPSLSRDIERDPHWAPWQQAAADRGYRSALSLPLKLDGKPYGALALYAAEPDAFDAEDIRLLGELGADVSFAVAAIRERAARERAELEARRANSERDTLTATRDALARIIDTAEDAIVGRDLQGIVTSWNKSAERLFGYSAAEIIGRSGDILIPPNGRDAACTLVKNMLSGAHLSGYETERLTKDGRLIDVSLSLSPIIDETGTTIGSSSVDRDISDRVSVERKLKESEERYRSLIEQMNEGLMQVDEELVITFANSQICTMLGQTEDQLVGRCALDFMPEESRQHVQAEAERRRAGGSERYELAWTNRDGQQLMTLISAGPIFDEQRRYRGSVCVVTDLTELKQAERELVQYRAHLEELVASRTEQLETANRELETFSYSVSHDLRVPLRAIDGYAHILLDDYADRLDDEGKRLLKVVRDSTVKLGRLIDDMLAFSRAGRTKMDSELVDMEALVREILADSLAPSVAGSSPAIEIGKLPPARGDRAMLERVWTNLLDNAIKFSAPKPESRIEVGATPGSDETIYYVRDHGIGFDMQYAGKLFGVFQRLHGAEVPGTGIGLAIIKRLIGRHGGRVWAEGKVNEGASFFFTLPKRENADGGQ